MANLTPDGAIRWSSVCGVFVTKTSISQASYTVKYDIGIVASNL